MTDQDGFLSSIVKLQSDYTHLRDEVAQLRAANARLEAKLDDMRLDIHGAKIAGRVTLGIALVVGSIVGWVVRMIIPAATGGP